MNWFNKLPILTLGVFSLSAYAAGWTEVKLTDNKERFVFVGIEVKEPLKDKLGEYSPGAVFKLSEGAESYRLSVGPVTRKDNNLKIVLHIQDSNGMAHNVSIHRFSKGADGNVSAEIQAVKDTQDCVIDIKNEGDKEGIRLWATPDTSMENLKNRISISKGAAAWKWKSFYELVKPENLGDPE